ncbi:MAG: CoA transferase [Alphaproteobacteria bacterium]|nr:CoA transferase [Alphaproteobacteria bacterium]
MAETGSSPGCLDGIRVLDMSRIVAGPFAAQMLADLGADVIKIERPKEGDDVRLVGPPWLPGTVRADRQSTYFQAVNRSKRSLTVDFTTSQGRELMLALIAKSDVLIENYKTGNLGRYGLGYEDAARANPGIVYCSITGFGQTGPLAARPGYDYLIQAMSGLMSITGHPDGQAGAGPMRVGVPICDVLAGQNAVAGILAALMMRGRTGRGQHIDVALYDSQLAGLLNPAAAWLNGQRPWPRSGNDHPSAVPYGVFKAADGFIMIATFTDREFGRFAAALGRPELGADPRFLTTETRLANRHALVDLVNDVVGTQPRAHWIERCARHDVPCGPIQSVGEALDSDQAQARGMTVELKRDDGVAVTVVGSPIKMSAVPPVYRGAPPRVGEHSDAVLRDVLGLDAAAVARLREAGVV